MGPSIRHFLLLFAKMLAKVPLLVEAAGEPVPALGSDVLFEWDVNALCILQSIKVVSRDPVTRYLLSEDKARQVTGA